ncbi:uncharacterized protein BDR25DRAFT_301135 [Lindgomyces ingoldianus]|uniref:Uncharacterized protein n=1 Tax=Lindgomyces ingoldianus TaxID=673940 RepID=A0ACB6R9R1_9PLEO|nr:uncharacterized protein BDR25DRAFT_301135 [Lindgomyces ingoldianus]KAF2475493.1 hypothetical protein BDR25DRAFT_301135 [Lindgomyces ingoldianus]
MAGDGVRFCVEDTVSLKDDKFMVGVVDRSFGDVDSHEPRPQRDYSEDIERHPDIPKDHFSKFMKTGIPPRGAVLVSWQTAFKTELLPESRLELLDRALYVGDVVKRHAQDPMSGTVIGTKAVCTLFPATMFQGGQLTTVMTEDFSLRAVPASELINVHDYQEGALVIYDDWVGRIEDVYDEVAVKLSNNSVVVVEAPEDLEPDDQLVDRLSVGDTVKTKKGNLRRGRWRYGAFDPHVRPEGTVVETRAVMINVQWLARKFGSAGSPYGANGVEPPTQLYTDELESANFSVYDASRGASSTLPMMANGVDRSYHVAEVAVGDRVRFKDLAGAAAKYDGTHSLSNGYPQGKLRRISRTETLGYDLNVYLVMQTQSQVTVMWQDLTMTEDRSPSLIPDPNVEDDDEVWPGEIVCTKEQRKDKSSDETWTFEPAKVGVVQSVKPRDRIATVRWFEGPSIRFLADDLIPPSHTGNLRDETEDVSLYDIRSTPSLTRRRGDFVLIHSFSATQPEVDMDAFDSESPVRPAMNEWFGEVIDLGLDGKVTVRLGAARPVVDVQVPAERITLVYSSDMDNQFDIMPTLEGESIGSDEEDSDFDSASFNEMWVEYEGFDGEPIGHSNEEDWSTEEEDEDADEDEDEEMPDIIPRNGDDTSKTTPQSQSDGEQKKSSVFVNSRSVDDSSSSQDMPRSTSPMAMDPPIPIPQGAPAEVESETLTPTPFLILDAAPPLNHHYLSTNPTSSTTLTRRIAKEHKILRSSLPSGIFVRTWESRLDLLRILIIGPSDTPYEYAPFIIDFHLPPTYPNTAPSAYFHSWTHGNGPVNPNLYEDGKICLSLLGTWHADERNESWSPAKSTLLQVLVSLMGLVLVKEPYYNEAGYDVHRSAPETKLASALYTERAYFRARAFIVHVLENEVVPFTQELDFLYRGTGEAAPRLLDKAIAAARDVLERSKRESDEGERDGLRKISLGAVVMLKRQVERLEALRAALP